MDRLTNNKGAFLTVVGIIGSAIGAPLRVEYRLGDTNIIYGIGY